MENENAFNFGAPAEQAIKDLEQKRANEAAERKQKFEDLKVGTKVSFKDKNGKWIEGWEVVKKNPADLTVCVMDPNEIGKHAFDTPTVVLIENIVIDPTQ